MSKIIFSKVDGDNQVEIRMSGHVTWMEVTDNFVDFLRGAGYGVTKDDVIQYLKSATDQVSGQDWGHISVSTTDSEYNFGPLSEATLSWFKK